MEVVTGYKRSYSVVVRKLLNNDILSGYPRVYPTAVDVANGYFVLGGAQIPVMTQNELQNLTQSEYEARISLLKNYVIQQEGMNPFTNQFNENVVYDPENCVPQEITTTTTEPIVTTSTTTQIPVTTSTTTQEVTTTTTTQGVYPVKYGVLYNWYAATDNRNITSLGWHIPTLTEIQTLSTYLGGSSVSGQKLKESGTTHWNVGNNGTNDVAFNLRGSGLRSGANGSFLNIKVQGYLISSTEFTNPLYYWGSYTTAPNTQLTFSASDYIKTAGYPRRPIKDSTTLTHGQTGIYVGNDGKVYRTICIGTQEWLADNLCETKYRNGDLIHGYDGGTYTPISNANWAALTTEAMCFYDDNEGNG